MSVEREIAEIHARLAALSAPPVSDPSLLAAELAVIRAQLRKLADSNDAIGQRLGESLGLRASRADLPLA
jgi:hypothetical protein